MKNSGDIDQLLNQAIGPRNIPGVVAMAATNEDIIYEAAFGHRLIGADTAMTTDTVVWIASMTKAVTAVAAMQLVEKGEISLDEPASQFIQELSQVQVLDGFDRAGAPRLRSPERAITLRQLLTHTSGFSYPMWNADLARFMEIANVPDISTCKYASLLTPLMFDPGTRWEYGIGIDWVGRIVETTSGQKLGAYMQEHIFAPLGMDSTSFRLTPAQRQKQAGMHARGQDGSLQVTAMEIEQEPEFEMGGGGLYSTAQDYIRLTQMLLNEGSLNDNQILQAETVHLMAQNHIGALDVTAFKTVAPDLSNDANFYPEQAQKWGLSFLINTEQTAQGRSSASLAWAGLANTYFWIDPKKHITGIFLTQILPFFDPAAISLFQDFEAAIYA